MIVFDSLIKQGLLSIDESTLSYENGKLTAKISVGSYTEVDSLPSIEDAKEGTTYLVPTGDYYTMYVVDKANKKWIAIGTTSTKNYEFGDGLVEANGVVTLDAKPKAIRDYFVNVDQWGAVVPYLAIQNDLDVSGDIATESALKGETLEIGDTIGVDSVGLYDTRTTYPDDGKYVVNKYLLEERIKDLTLSVPTNLSQLNNDVGFATQSWTSSQITSSRNQCVLKSGSTMTGALTINNDLKALPLGYTTSMGVPAYGLQVSSTYGLQLFGTHFLNGTLWGNDGLKIVNNNLSLNSLDEVFISSDYANTTTFRAMPNDGVQATYKFEGWGWDDDSHTTKSPRLGVRLLKPNQATALESTSVLNMSEGDNRWVSLSGGTMTGYLNIPSPTSSSHPTTKSYVDNLVGSGGGLQNLSTGTGSLSILGNATTSESSVTIGSSSNASGSPSLAVGLQAQAFSAYTTAWGVNAVSSEKGAMAFGLNSYAYADYSIALGVGASSHGKYSTSIGYKAKSPDAGSVSFATWDDNASLKTFVRFIGANSTASTTKLGGKSGIEYEEYDARGVVTQSGVISFEDLVSGGGGGSGGGLENLATGDSSLSILGAATTSLASTSVGVGANASGEQSTALGFQATASAKYSNAFGIGANASVLGATAVGWKAVASSNNTVAIGTQAKAINAFSIAIGLWAEASEQDSIAIGDSAAASGTSATAIGTETEATANYSTALGHKANASDNGVTVLSATNDDGSVKTQLYLIGAGSTMSITYCGGEAGLGFVFEDSDGEIVKRGTIKLSALCTENTDTFEPSGW